MTEIVQSNTREARERAARIRIGMVGYLTTLGDIAKAYEARDWLALGYDSWQDYVDGEYSETRLRLPAEHRAKAIAELRMAGMSQRAIASAVGVSVGTVNADLSGVQDRTPDEITGADGKTYAATRPTNSPPGPDPSDLPGSPVVATPDRAGLDHPAKGEVPTPGLATVARTAESEAPVGQPPTGAGDPLDDPEHIEVQRRHMASKGVAEGLVSLALALDPDPIRWLSNTWMPDAYKLRDLPRVREVFTPSGLHGLADHLHKLADHLAANRETL